jgi:threonine aldolase
LHLIDLRSDTTTLPSQEMLRAMFASEIGDDAFGEDSTTNLLEEYIADLFGKQAAIFTPSGTMSNQIALRVHTRPGDEVILDESYHFNVYESAPSADLAGVSLNTVKTDDGILTPAHISLAIDSKSRDPRYCQPALLSLENTINFRGGRVVPLAAQRSAAEFAQSKGLRVHLDGARLFNAAVASGTTVMEYAATVDTLSVCFAKGLGAPFGSVLAGPTDLIVEARTYRKSYGGAMHQSGHLAGAALYALQHNVSRLAEDHANAKHLALILSENPSLGVSTTEVETNIVIVDLTDIGLSARTITNEARRHGLLIMQIGQSMVRFVTHLGITTREIARAASIFHDVINDTVTSRQQSLPLTRHTNRFEQLA